jgi:hypothetical protein
VRINELQAQIEEVKKVYAELRKEVSCYMVVCMAHTDFAPEEISVYNMKLFKNKKIFTAISDNNIDVYKQYACLYKKLEDAPKNTDEKDLKKMKSELAELTSSLSLVLKALDFVPAQFELRFYSLETEKIQQIKQHPLVQKIGKTDMSAASIRIVIG